MTLTSPDAPARAAAEERKSRRRRIVAGVLALLLVGLVVSAGLVAWYYAGMVLTPGGGALPAAPVDVLASGPGSVTLSSDPLARRPGLYGLDYDGGYARVGAIHAQNGRAVRRALRPFEGPVDLPDEAVLDSFAYPRDPHDAFAFDVRDVLLENSLGAFPAWYVEGRSDGLWAIYVHGRGSSRAEGFRTLPILRAAGLPTLFVTYRNDPGAPVSPDGLYGLGWTEWRDLRPAVAFARDRGASGVVLIGASMGGAIVSTFVHEAPEADFVRGLVLDAPVLDWGVTLRLAARRRGLPEAIVPLGMLGSTVRGGIPFDRLDQLARAEEFDTPILLFHGTADETVPVELSDAFAAARPRLVTYVRVPGAGHVQAWNVDRQGYTAALLSFLAELDSRLPAAP